MKRRRWLLGLAAAWPSRAMPRGTRALRYHAFTAGPLVVMNELAQAAASPGRPPSIPACNAWWTRSPMGWPIRRALAPQERPSPATLVWLLPWHRHDREPARLAPWLQGLPAVPTLGGDLALMAPRGWPPR